MLLLLTGPGVSAPDYVLFACVVSDVTHTCLPSKTLNALPGCTRCVLLLQRFEQVVASRNRLATRLSRANRYVAHLEAELAGRSADVSAAAASLAEAGAQLQQLLRQARRMCCI